MFKVTLFIFPLIFLSVHSLENMAVVEHAPKKNDAPMNTIKENINEYRRHLEKIKDNNVDVIVFPEYGLTGYVEDVENYAINIKNSQIIKELSDMSSEYQINMVVNLLEKHKDDIYCNTNLVFNKTGAIIAKYRKINLNPVTETNLTAGSEVVEFMLEGKLFSTITNDDILFEYPTKNFSMGVTHVAIPMNWKNLRPFNTATSIQSAYAIKNNKVVLAANLNDMENYKSGSGIHSPDASESFITSKKRSDVFNTHELLRRGRDPGNTDNKDLDEIPLDIMEFISEANVYDWYDFTYNGELNYEHQNCSIYFPMDDQGLDPLLPWGILSSYKEIYLNGRPYEVRMCAYVACDTQNTANFQIEKCGKRYKRDDIIFEKVAIKTNLDFAKSMPITLDYNLKPIEGVTWREVNGTVEMEVTNIRQMINIVAVVEFNPIEAAPITIANVSHNLKLPSFLFIILIFFVRLL